MESTITVAYGVQANSPAPLFRVVGGAVVSSYRPVSGQECPGFGAPVSQVESAQQRQLSERAHVRSAQGGRRELLLAQNGGDNGISGFNGSDSYTDGTKPMTLWGYRTSSPPG